VVSRSIVEEMKRTGDPHMYLDLTHRDAAFIARRFPRIHETCLSYGVDITRQPAPVHPAAHYAMGGVRTDLEGKTDIQRLYAAGEVACTGVHGANRLASNSLLEGVVFGHRAGVAMREWAGRKAPERALPVAPCFPEIAERDVRALTWECCGIIRSEESLRRALQRLTTVTLRSDLPPGRAVYQCRNIHILATLIARCALAREESRGGHRRTDFPEPRPEFQKHSLIRSSSPEVVTFYAHDEPAPVAASATSSTPAPADCP
jgi:L-aspartate oxidase